MAVNGVNTDSISALPQNFLPLLHAKLSVLSVNSKSQIDSEICIAIIGAVSRLRYPESVSIIETCAKQARNPSVRDAAKDALAQFSS